jgi:hypothetical protein
MKENAMTYKAEATGGREREIAERLKRITPGTWLYNSYNLVATIDYQDDNDEVCWVPVSAGDTATKQGGYNAEFIANAPDDIRYLLAELTRVNAERDNWKTEAEKAGSYIAKQDREYDDLESQLERLKQALPNKIISELDGSVICGTVFIGETDAGVIDDNFREGWNEGIARARKIVLREFPDALAGAVAAPPTRNEFEVRAAEAFQAIQDADAVMKVLDDWTERGLLNSRSAAADARLNYSKPYTYLADRFKILLDPFRAALSSPPTQPPTEAK